MPEIKLVPENPNSNTVEVELSKDDLAIDPRVIKSDYEGWNWKFDCTIDGRTLTVTRIDRDEGWRRKLYFPLYDPTVEEVPPFDNKCCTYH